MKTGMQFVPRFRRLHRLLSPHIFGSRTVKDRLFCYIFEHDKKALLQIYNALNHTDYQDEGLLQIVTLDNAVYMAMNNDVAFILLGTLSMYEHQSTFCPNLPLRFLLYLAAEYEGLVARTGANIYGMSLIPLPAPQCIVFYNGEDETEDEQRLRLTDAFVDDQGQNSPSCLELTIRMLNINHGRNSWLMACCRRLDEYSYFVDRIREYRKCGFSTDDAIDSAAVYCIDHGIMDDILLPFRAEVKKMLLTEYNERKYMKMFRKEARKEGLEEGRQEGRQEGQRYLLATMLQNGAPEELLSEWAGIPLSEIRKHASASDSPHRGTDG